MSLEKKKNCTRCRGKGYTTYKYTMRCSKQVTVEDRCTHHIEDWEKFQAQEKKPTKKRRTRRKKTRKKRTKRKKEATK